MALWIRLFLVFSDAVEVDNQDLTRRILNYACWCVSERAGRLPNDTSTAAVCGFYETVAAEKKFWPFFSQWFFAHEFNRLLPNFRYHLDDEEAEELKKVYEKGSRSEP